LRPAGLAPLLPVPSAELGIDLATFSRSTNGPGGSALLTRMANLLFAAAFRSNPACRAQLESSLRDPIARAKMLIEKNPFEPWQVETLAARVGMGRSNFATRFVNELGMTPITLVNEERMKHAEALLRSTHLNVAEISERLGYRSEATFIRRFTTIFGVTPGKWRRDRPTA
jgi:AraC-like DNA-binding protein